MKRKKEVIYLLFSCDVWKSKPMNLVTATMSRSRLKQILVTEIFSENMIYGDETISPLEQVRNFEKDWEKEALYFINTELMYGFIEEILDGETLQD